MRPVKWQRICPFPPPFFSTLLAVNENGFKPLRFSCLATKQRISPVCFSSVMGGMLLWEKKSLCRLQVGSSICDEEVSSWPGPHGVVQAAARWSIIYYRTSLLLRHVTNALHRDGLQEVNAARLTPVPCDKHCQCSIRRSSSSAKCEDDPLCRLAEGCSGIVPMSSYMSFQLIVKHSCLHGTEMSQ